MDIKKKLMERIGPILESLPYGEIQRNTADRIAESLIEDESLFISDRPRFLVQMNNAVRIDDIPTDGPCIFINNDERIVPLYHERWIPVTERLPEVQQRILVYCESKTIRKHVTACTYMGGYLGSKQFSRHVRNVTHWMPLPEPPKEEENEQA